MARNGTSMTALMLATLALAPAAGLAQPAGPAFRVNNSTTGSQREASVASNPAGGFVVAWSSIGQDSPESRIFCRRYAISGEPIGGEFRVNSLTTLSQYDASVAVGPSGGFVVVWDGDFGDPFSSIVGRRFSSAGVPLAPDFRVNSTTAPQYRPRVAADSTGGFVVVWMGYVGAYFDVFGRRFASNGEPLGLEFRVNTSTPLDQLVPAIAMNQTGGFVVVWQSYGQDGSDLGVFARRYSSAGAPLGSEFRVNTYTTGYQGRPAVAFDTAGRFIVVWQSHAQDAANEWAIFGQRFSSAGAPLGSEFEIAEVTTSLQFVPAIASDGGGGFVVSWETHEADGWSENVLARAFRGSGAPAGLPFRVNADPTGYSTNPSVASDAKGNFVVVWEAIIGAYNDVFGQRFLPMMLKGDANANGVVDVADVFYLINHLFAGGPSLQGSGDVNGDGTVNVVDIFYLINYLFAGGPAPL